MTSQKKSVISALGGTLAATLIMMPAAHAGQNPFSLKPLSKGYMVAEADQAASDDDKMKDGNCSAEMMEKEGSGSADAKDHEGNCSAEMKHPEEESQTK